MIPVAQYMRMSSEHQRYSIENQATVISEFARQHGLSIVETYLDPAKSGLHLKGRVGLRQLLEDALSSHAGYKAVLVLDVSRWGRFQDDDEAACYEFLCRNAGVPVVYCAENFANDGSVASSILKNLSRANAREFSRELSVKVFQTKSLVAQRGFWVGGPAPFAYRRMLVSQNPKRNQILQHGQRKYLSMDRVVLVPGPAHEITIVKAIYSLLLKNGLGINQITARLNKLGMTNRGAPWIRHSVRKILTSPVYAGCNVWHRTSQKFGGCCVRTTPDKWIRKANAFAPVVSQLTFNKVQSLLAKRRDRDHWTKDKILFRLREYLKKNRMLSEEIFRARFGMPSAGTIRRHFGTVVKAYELVGYRNARSLRPRVEALKRHLDRRNRLLEMISSVVPASARFSNLSCRPRLHLSNGATISILIVSGIMTQHQQPRWPTKPSPYERKNPVLLCFVVPSGQEFHSFYLLPRLPICNFHRMRENDPLLSSARRLNDISELIEAVKTLADDFGGHHRVPEKQNANDTSSLVP